MRDDRVDMEATTPPIETRTTDLSVDGAGSVLDQSWLEAGIFPKSASAEPVSDQQATPSELVSSSDLAPHHSLVATDSRDDGGQRTRHLPGETLHNQTTLQGSSEPKLELVPFKPPPDTIGTERAHRSLQVQSASMQCPHTCPTGQYLAGCAGDSVAHGAAAPGQCVLCTNKPPTAVYTDHGGACNTCPWVYPPPPPSPSHHHLVVLAR